MQNPTPKSAQSILTPIRALRTKRQLSNIARALGLALSCLTLPTSSVADAADKQNLMIVFDASGSMWGQIDGVAKIEMARDAFANAQSSFAGEGQKVGLIAYGHRRKGDCGDIETLVPLSNAAGSIVADQIQTLRPKGKTPLSDAIRLAAQDMRFREDAATVVLFSDGIETCNVDPCAVAAELERDGISFTAHVIGFGLSGDTDRTQLQCIADNTGGLFLEASNASGLQDALSKVAAPPVQAQTEELESIPVRVLLKEAEGTSRPPKVSFRATNEATGRKIFLGTVRGADEVINGLQAEMPLGDWTVEAISEEGSGRAAVSVTASLKQIDVPFAAIKAGFDLLAEGPFRLGVDNAFFLGVSDPLQANAEYTVALFPAGATEVNQRLDWETRFGTDGAGYTEHGLMSPDAAGAYEIVIFQGSNLSEANARFPITFEDGAPIQWKGKTRAQPGEALPILISGDTYRNNTLSLRSADGTDISREWLQAYFTTETGPVLSMPDAPGIYDLFYRATTEDAELRIGQIAVGDIVQEDDPDAVAPPAEDQAEASTAQTSTLEIAFKCEQPACFYSNEAMGLTEVPLLSGFGIANEARDDEGRPSFDVVNLQTGDVIIHNPVFMVNAMDCFVASENGRNEGVETDTLCLSQSSDGQTVAQFETLEGWAATQNAQASESDLAKARASHDAAMGEDPVFTQPDLMGGWSLIVQGTPEVIGILAMEPQHSDSVLMDLLLYGGATTGLDGAKQVSMPVTVIADDAGAVLAVSGVAEDMQLQLSRPPNWDGLENIFSGLVQILPSGQTIRVELF